MRLSKAAPVLLGMAVLGAAFLTTVKADDYDHMTTVTFSAPVEIPPVYITGMRVLPAGTYVFKLVNSSSDRHIVQIFNKERTKIYATILAIPDYRLTPKDKTVITFNEGIAGQPEAVRAWFYPGANWGEEFVYPKAKAIALAKVTRQPVLAVTAPLQEEVEQPEQSEILAQLQKLPLVAVRPTGEEVEIAQVVQSAPPAAAPVQTAAAAPAPATLPATASPMPLIGLCGLLALGGALALRTIGPRV